MSEELQGFYYDVQKSQPETSITLHANTELINGEWYEWGHKMDGVNLENTVSAKKTNLYNQLMGTNYKRTDHLEGMYVGDAQSNIKDDDRNPRIQSSNYGAAPIATSILNEDFQYLIQNTWSDTSGNNEIENMWRNLQQSGPMIGALSRIFGEGLNSVTAEGSVTSWLKGMGIAASKAGSSFSKFLNNALVVQGNRFSIYQGTNTDFLNLSMKFTLFSDWLPVGEGGKYEFVSVLDQLEDLYPYFQGQYSSFTKQTFIDLYDDAIKEVKKWLDTEGKKDEKDSDWETINGIIQDLENASKGNGVVAKIAGELNGMAGIQKAPAGYIVTSRNVDACLRGTFRIVFGGKYAIENLLGTNMNVTLSKSLIKAPKTDNSTLDFVPMSADVVLNFKCASSFSNKILQNFTSGIGARVQGTGQSSYKDMVLDELGKVQDKLNQDKEQN